MHVERAAVRTVADTTPAPVDDPATSPYPIWAKGTVYVEVMVMDALDVVGRFGEAWGAHDLDATMALVTAEVVFESTGPAPDGNRFVGCDAVRLAWAPIFADPQATFTVEDTHCVSGDRVVQCWSYDWGEGHIRGVDLFTVRDGLVAEKLSYVKG